MCRYYFHNINICMPHQCSSTEDLMAKAAAVTIQHGDFMLKADVENFFMAPEHPDLIYPVSSHCRTKALTESLDTVLSNQFVFLQETNTLYKVLKGSGMGGQVSSDLCDFAFHRHVESTHLSEASMQEHKIKIWLRYRDDIFLIGSFPRLAQKLISEIRLASNNVWSIVVEQFSRGALPFLDVECFFSGSRILFRSYCKPSKISIPLNPFSSQPAHVHWWPVGVLSRLARNSSREHEFQECLYDFAQKLAEHRIKGDVFARVISHSSAWHHLRTNKHISHGKARKIVLVLPFHMVWQAGQFSKVLAQHVSLYHETLFRLHHDIFEFEACWKCTDPISKILFRRNNLCNKAVG